MSALEERVAALEEQLAQLAATQGHSERFCCEERECLGRRLDDVIEAHGERLRALENERLEDEDLGPGP